MNKRLLAGLVLLISQMALAQTRIQGRVTDAATGKPLPFASVYLNTTTRGTTADEKGQYYLSNVPAGTVEVVASFLGYKQAKVFVTLRPASPATVNLVLSPAGKALMDVTVTAKRSKAWERLLRVFKNELLGDSPFTGRCVLVNEQAITLTQQDDHLLAQASEPLVIDNKALGYRIHYDMLAFDYSRQMTYYAGASRFEELTPESPQQQRRWQRNRQIAYEGSTRHLLASLITNTHEQEGYLVFQSTMDVATRSVARTPILQFDGQAKPRPVQPDSIFGAGSLPTERLMYLKDGPLEVFYTRATARNSPYHDMPYAYSLLVLPNKTALVTTDGWVASPNGMEVRGYLGRDRLANLLPADWRPATDAITTQAPTLADGVILPPDSQLDTLKRHWRAYQKTALPTVFIHTDKYVYTTGDDLWFSAYVLNPTTLNLLPNRYEDVSEALHLDWLSPSGQTIYHQWVAVKNGRAEGVIPLPDSLKTGYYTLRAYTEAGRAASRPAFEQRLPVMNGLQSDLPAEAPTAGLARPTLPPSTLDSLGFRLDADSSGISARIQALGAYRDQPVYLTVQNRERFVGQAKIRLVNGQAQISIPALNVPSGLLRLALFDAQGRPHAERLQAVSSQPVRVVVTPNKTRYAPRESVSLTLRLEGDAGEPVTGFMSVAITDASQTPVDSQSTNFRRLILDPPRPRLYADPAQADTSVGMVIRGQAIDGRGRPIPKAKVLLAFMTKTEPFARSAQADESGRFQIDGVALIDTAEVSGHVLGPDFKPVKGTVRIDSPSGSSGPGPSSPGPSGLGPSSQAAPGWTIDTTARPDWSRYRNAIQAARLRQADNPGQYRQRGAQQLQEVTVKATKSYDDSQIRRRSLHGTPDAAIVIDGQANQFSNVYEMMRGRLPGVQVNSNAMMTGYSVVVRGVGSLGGNNAPLYIWNGQYIQENAEGNALMMINAAEIERIELVKNSGASIYGARGGAGVIAFYSRTWRPDKVDDKANKMTLIGFSRPRSFTIPATGSPADSASVDRRDVLLWQPRLQSDDQGQVQLSFPLSDVARTLRVTVQGITAQGYPISAEQLIDVQ